jgi:hypothetical protein
MRSGLGLAAGVTAAALMLTGAFCAFIASKVSPPSAVAAEAPLSWEVAPPPGPARPPLVVRASAARWSAPRARKRDCPAARAAISDAAGPGPALAVAAADAFRVRLEPSPQTPQGYAYADAVRAALARQGAVAARPSGRVIWSVDRQFVARLDDGSHIAVVGGYGVTELSLRELTPGVCRLLFAAAEDARAYVAYPGAAPTPPDDGPRALCARLRPAFDAWRRSASIGPLDLADLDRRDVVISMPGPVSALARPGPARQALFY